MFFCLLSINSSLFYKLRSPYEKCIRYEAAEKQRWRGVEKAENQPFTMFQPFYMWQSVIHHHGVLMVEVKKGGKKTQPQYQYEFFIWWILRRTAFQAAARVKVHRKMKAGKDWKARKEIIVSLDIKNKHFLFYFICLQQSTPYSYV